MGILGQVAIILGVALVGEVVSDVLPFVMPGSVVGMILMFLLLYGGLVRECQVGRVADFFIENMAIIFIPFAVGIVEIYPLVEGKAIALLTMCVLTTILTFGVTLGVTMFMLRLLGRGGDHGK